MNKLVSGYLREIEARVEEFSDTHISLCREQDVSDEDMTCDGDEDELAESFFETLCEDELVAILCQEVARRVIEKVGK